MPVRAANPYSKAAICGPREIKPGGTAPRVPPRPLDLHGATFAIEITTQPLVGDGQP